jgi:hypothetical protein
MLPRFGRQFFRPRQDADGFLAFVDDECLQPVVDEQDHGGDDDDDQRQFRDPLGLRQVHVSVSHGR